MQMETNSFASQLAAARKACGMTQEQLGERMHMSRQGISHWENGRALPDAETLKELSQVLGYDFVTSEALGAAEAPDAPQPPSEAEAPAGKPLWQQPVLYLSVAVLLLAAALVLVMLPGRQDAAAPQAGGVFAPVTAGSQAKVEIVPHQNPITPSIDPVLGPSPWWIYRLTIQETAGVDFAVEKMTTTYTYTDGQTMVIEQGAESIAANWGTNVVSQGLNRYWNGAEPLRDYASITVRLDGTDAKGNVLSFDVVILTAQDEPTSAPTMTRPADPEAAARVAVEAAASPVSPGVCPELGDGLYWLYTFRIAETAGVDFAMDTVRIIYTTASGQERIYAYGAGDAADWWGSSVLIGGASLTWEGAQPVDDTASVTMQVDGTDANGNALSAEGTILFQAEAAE